MKAIKLPVSFPVSEVFAALDIYMLRSKKLEDFIIIELEEFDYAVLKAYITQKGDLYGSIEL